MDSKQCGNFNDEELRILSDALLARRYSMSEDAKDSVANIERTIAENRADISKEAMLTKIADIKIKTKNNDLVLQDIEERIMGCIYSDQFVSHHKKYLKT